MQVSRMMVWVSALVLYGVQTLQAADLQIGSSQPEWNNPSVIQIGAEAPRATFTSYPSRDAALRGGVSDLVLNLNGDWKFAWSPNPNERPQGFQELAFDDSAWGTLPVPSNWQLHGYGVPYNINTGYGFDFSKLKAPVEGNEVGSYRHIVELPKDWNEKEVFLHFGGVGSAFYLWINGEYVGYSQGSKTPSEFSVSDYLKAGENLIAVQVFDSVYRPEHKFPARGIRNTLLQHLAHFSARLIVRGQPCLAHLFADLHADKNQRKNDTDTGDDTGEVINLLKQHPGLRG